MQPGLGLAAQPFYLDTRGGTVLCWWHAPAQPAVAHPVLMCPTWGDEEIGAYAGWRALANSLALQGVPVLRLDLPGEGDSLPRAAGASAWSSWLDALDDAALALLQVSGSPKVHLLGLRLGALLAAQLADRLRQRADQVASLLLLAPVASGRAFLREARLLSQVPQGEPLQAGEAMAGGFVLDAPSAEALAAAQWPTPQASGQRAACPVLLLERSDRPLPEAARASLAAWAGVERLQGEVRDDLATTTAIAHSAVWPDLTQPLRSWLVQAGAAASDLVGLVWPGVAPSAAGPGWTEELVSYGPGLVAQCTRPASRSARATLFLSSGAERRIGPHRLWVDFARQCAARGELCLRLDLGGIGDSVARDTAGASPSRADQVYDARCVDDVRAALRWLEQTHGVTQVRLVGLCSGAYHAWRCAVAGLRLSHVVAINPLVYHWRSGMSLDPTHHAFGQIDIADGAVRSLKDPARWMKLLRGQVHVRVILRAMAARLMGRLQNISRHVGRRLHWPLSEDVVSDLRQVIRHATPLSFVFSEGDPGQALLRQEAGSFLKGQIASARVHLTTIERSDHTFSTRTGRDSLYNCLNSILSAASDFAVREDQNLASVTPQQS
ncbi:alpha/beta fold hydrolase [Ideonella paludis]|uniref:alpha/beta fold hydrolase n=1 Tax=Ideonella paludis TaxID=1233411 RepID=UPI002873D3B8|nr:alpha/beta fold hydrolase [Ideonella paludis]